MLQQQTVASYRFIVWSQQISGDSGAGVAVVNDNPVVVVGRRGCCMAHVVKRFLMAHGVSSTVHEVGQEADESALIADLGGSRDGACCSGEKRKEEEIVLPVVFIEGELVGGLERVMAAHFSGELVTKLKEARAIWL